MAGKNLENTLDILGSGLNLAGKVLFGLDNEVNIGEPLQILGAHMRQKRQTSSLIDTLQSVGQQVPEAQPLLQGAQQLAASGGLLKQAAPLPPPGPSPVEQGGLLGTLQGLVPAEGVPAPAPITATAPTLPPPAPQAGSSVQFSQTPTDPNSPSTQITALLGLDKVRPDYSSPQFLSKLAKDNPELASKILLQQGGSRNQDPLDTISKVLGILNYRTPEQRSQIDVQEFAQKQQIGDTYQTKRKEQADELARGQLKPGEIERLKNTEGAISSFRALPDSLPKLSSPQAVVGKIPVVGGLALSYLNKNLAQLDKQITAANATLAFGDGGKNLTGIEKQITFGVLPNIIENPKLYPQVKALTESRLKLKLLADKKELFDAGRRGDQFNAQEISDFGRWRDILNKYGERAFSDPGFLEESRKLGLAGLATKFK